MDSDAAKDADGRHRGFVAHQPARAVREADARPLELPAVGAMLQLPHEFGQLARARGRPRMAA